MKQYESSKSINGLIYSRASCFETDWQNQFFNVIWNVDTANGLGLDIWGRIVVIGRTLEVPEGDYFGFNTGDPESWTPFNTDAFYSGQNLTSTYILQDSAYRALILAKALSNISDTNCKSLNRVLANLFPGRGNAYVLDKGKMQMEYVFEFYLEPWERTIVYADGILPRPAGVQISVIEGSGGINEIYNAATRLYNYANYTLPPQMMQKGI